MSLQIMYDPSCPSSVVLARQRWMLLRHAIPANLDHAARLLDEMLGVLGSTDLPQELGERVEIAKCLVADVLRLAVLLREAMDLVPVPQGRLA